jgi:hypothetical protein
LDGIQDTMNSPGFDREVTKDEAVSTAAAVFESMFDEMGIDPVNRPGWRDRFIQNHRACLRA